MAAYVPESANASADADCFSDPLVRDSSQKKATSLATGRILVVDDQVFFCESIKRMLVSDGHTVATATSGLTALELFQRLRFDLVITDYDMPVMPGDKLSSGDQRSCSEHSRSDWPYRIGVAFGRFNGTCGLVVAQAFQFGRPSRSRGQPLNEDRESRNTS